jgi:acyl-CoA reductase-like NAD-dependent aldehyde dehydrogenase
MQELHDSGLNRSYWWRKEQLQRMLHMVQTHREEFAAALYQDLGKSRVEAIGMEIAILESELKYVLSNLSKWMRPWHVPSPGLAIPAFTRLVPTPKIGPACLVFGAFNYPFILSLQPAAGALAAGNPVVIKPSEQAPETARLLQKYCDRYFDKSALRVVQGGVAEAAQLLKESWGLVFFTGSSRVGKLVAVAAAQTLTPTVMELGGKCPCYVDETAPADITQVANRIIWAKTANAGQTCASVDTLIVHESVVNKLLPKLVKSLRVQFPEPGIESELARIRIPQHAQRLVDWIQEVEASCGNTTNVLLCGGSAACQAEKGYIEPTIVLNPSPDCRMMQEEIFGPILPIVTVKSRQEAIDFIRKNMPGTPLCLYVFARHDVFEEIRQACPAGSVVRNDCLVHLSSPCIPFGGLGTSGYGAYHGHFSFQTFSHLQPVMYRPCAPGLDFGMARYHPFGDGIKAWLIANVLLKMPLIPVLHMRKLLPLVFFALIVALQVM